MAFYSLLLTIHYKNQWCGSKPNDTGLSLNILFPIETCYRNKKIDLLFSQQLQNMGWIAKLLKRKDNIFHTQYQK